MKRLSNWPRLLNEFIASRRAVPFAWGSNDCCLFACDAVKAITGHDMAAENFRGKYDTALGAARLLDSHGGVSAVAETECAKAGFAEVPLLMAQRGDMVLMDTEDRGPALGICIGKACAFTGPDGVTLIPVSACRKAWRIG